VTPLLMNTRQGQSVLAAFVLERSMGSGRSHCSARAHGLTAVRASRPQAVAAAAAPAGGCVRDSHAEVLARRGLLRWLYRQVSPPRM
jgi:hypothetical protein